MPSLQNAILRHAKYYVGALQRANDLYKIVGIKEQQGLSLVDKEVTNIELAQLQMERLMSSSSEALKLMNALPDAGVYVLARRQSTGQQLHWREVALSAATQVGSLTGQAIHTNHIGIALAALGDYRCAITFYRKAQVLHRQNRNKRGEANALGNMGVAFRHLGRLAFAQHLFDRALQIHTSLDDVRGVLNELSNIASVYDQMGQHKEAISSHETVLQLCREMGNTHGEALALMNIAISDSELGDLNEALRLLSIAERLFQNLQDQFGLLQVTLNKANIQYRAGKLPYAIHSYKLILEKCKKDKYQYGEALTLWNLCLALWDSGEMIEAVKYAEEALSLYERLGIIDEKVDAHKIQQQISTWSQSYKSVR